MAKEQLCWTCKNACGGCDWSNLIEPVKGWTAKKVQRKSYETYRISECPEYIPDKKTDSEEQQRGMITKDELAEIKTMLDSGSSTEEIAICLNRRDKTVRKALAKIERQGCKETKAEKTHCKTSSTSKRRISVD